MFAPPVYKLQKSANVTTRFTTSLISSDSQCCQCGMEVLLCKTCQRAKPAVPKTALLCPLCDKKSNKNSASTSTSAAALQSQSKKGSKEYSEPKAAASAASIDSEEGSHRGGKPAHQAGTNGSGKPRLKSSGHSKK